MNAIFDVGSKAMMSLKCDHPSISMAYISSKFDDLVFNVMKSIGDLLVI